MFGGSNPDRAGSVNEAWVLTIPGFHWFQAPRARRGYPVDACNVVGKRQIVTLGGEFDKTGDTIADYGIGIFDLSEMRWKDSYDSDAAAYEAHEDIRDWYSKG